MVRTIRKVKKSLWLLTIPVWPLTRMCMGRWRIVWHEKDKDKKHLGYLRSDKTHREFIIYMRTHGFKKHYMAYKDVDELFSLRKFHNERFQYHIRFYKDGRITGHYELAPEIHTIKHLREIGLEFRRNEFMEFLNGWVQEHPHHH